MILVVGGIKGGSGKTTIATNLCQMRASIGKKVLFIDADDQGSAFEWYLHREAKGETRNPFVMVKMTGRSVYTNVIKMKDDYDDIIIDCGGRDSLSQRAALSIADTLLLPFKPRSLDIWTLNPVKALIEECLNHDLKVRAFINQADHKGNNNTDALDALKDCDLIDALPCLIGNRVAFANASSEGLGIFELTPKDEKACTEMITLHNYIYDPYNPYVNSI